VSACDGCLSRTALLGRLAPHLERAPRTRRALRDVLSLTDDALIDALGGTQASRLRADHEAFDPGAARAHAGAAGLAVVCRHGTGYPPLLRDDPAAPAVLHVRGTAELADLTGHDPMPPPPAVAIVGARRATTEALEVARGLGRALSAAGVTVVSGLALGVDSAAHEGALDGGGRTIAVLATGADRIYPRTKTGLGERIAQHGLIVSELPPGTPPFRWAFPARNRIIAGLAQLTLVVEAAERSGSLITADFALQLGREVAAVPGPARSARARGGNLLLRDGAHVVLDAADVLDGLLGLPAGTRPPAPPVAILDPRLDEVRAAVLAGRSTAAAIASGPGELTSVLAALSELELLGEVRRTVTGSYVATARPGGDA
jgi:DNA processing protein